MISKDKIPPGKHAPSAPDITTVIAAMEHFERDRPGIHTWFKYKSHACDALPYHSHYLSLEDGYD